MSHGPAVVVETPKPDSRTSNRGHSCKAIRVPFRTAKSGAFARTSPIFTRLLFIRSIHSTVVDVSPFLRPLQIPHFCSPVSRKERFAEKFHSKTLRSEPRLDRNPGCSRFYPKEPRVIIEHPLELIRADDEMQSYEVNEFLEYRRKYDSRGWALSEHPKRSSESRFHRTLIKYVKLYCKYTKLAGFKRFVESETTWFDRAFWSLLYVITVPTMIYTIYNGYMDTIEDPCLTNVETEYFPTQNMNFPGVSICTVNRISRRAALEMASEVVKANISYLSEEEILDMISQLGGLYESAITPQNHSYYIDELLLQVYQEYDDVVDIMKRLTPQCADVLVNCRFLGEERSCTEVFTFRKTQDGFCCTFNYATLGDDNPLNNGIDHRLEPLKVQNLGESNGLSVLLDPVENDDFYPILPITGWKVMIFNPHDYPDVASGGVIEVLMSSNVQRTVNLDALLSYSTLSVLPYSIDKRDCVFAEEMTSVRTAYTYSDCIVDCKIENILRVCKCIPFYWPNRASNRVCRLKDIPCLAKHRFKWVSIIPHQRYKNVEDDVEEIGGENVLHCYHCYPVCDDVTYIVSISEATLAASHHNTELIDNVRLENHSVLHVYFSRFGVPQLKQDVLFRWYELLSDASSTAGIYIGFSLICVMELVYFTWIFVCDLLQKTPSSSDDEFEAEVKPRRVQAIYWGELHPSVRLSAVTRRHGRNFDKY